PPIFVWALLTKNLKRAFVTAPWVLGVLIFVGLCLPWYLMAEIRSPGFLDYFIVGEHFNRFFNSAWQGDRYGFPKQQPL
ncbi:MAG: glycosyltransferase family 39 protein, partial [Flavobacteriaceae bacterium]